MFQAVLYRGVQDKEISNQQTPELICLKSEKLGDNRIAF